MALKCSRTRPIEDAERVTFMLDGEPIVARRGEPIALALLAAGVDVIARSIKYHRPRGPFCLDGHCEGCLARVEGRPNIPTCRTPAAEGLRVERQNAFPTAQVDFLQAIDWFFPDGMNHNEMFAWLPGPLHRAMQRVARRVGGLGTVPEAPPTAIPEVGRVRLDVLVVGAGPAGLAAATEAARRGRKVLLVEEEDTPGGCLRFDPADCAEGGARRSALLGEAEAAGVQISTGTYVAATYDTDTVVLAHDTHVEIAAVQDIVLCTGTYAQPALHEGNDLPGHLSARAVLRALLVHDVRLATRAVVTGADPLGDATAVVLSGAGARVARLAPGESVVRARGDSRVTSVVIADASGRTRSSPCDLVVVAEPPAPAFELAAQAGVEVEFSRDAGGFLPKADADGRTRKDRVRVAGHVAGARSIEGAVAAGRRAGAMS